MRISRFAPLLPVMLVLAGCATPNEPAGSKEDDSVFVAGDEQAEGVAIDLAEQHLLDRADLFAGVGNVFVKRALVNERGEAHVRVGQEVDGIPVFEGEAIVHFGKDGLFDSITDKLVRGIRVDTKPTLGAREAQQLAVLEMGGPDLLLGTPEIDLQILRHDGEDRLTYRVQLDMRTVEDELTMPVVFVDAHTGEIVWSYDNIKSSRDRKTYNGKNLSKLPGTLIRTEAQGPTGDAVADLAHDNAGYVYDYYQQRHGRDSFDGNGGTITSTVHHKINYVNAFWNGTQMVYGDGDGVNASPLVVLDVVGHEITHAVTERSSNLTYSGESGGLNEAISDMFGGAIEAFRDGAVSANTWKVGEECWTPSTPGDALRYMNDPKKDGTSLDYYPDYNSGVDVHYSSGIANLAFSLMVTGGTHPRGKTSNVVPALSSNAVTSIGMAAAIFYKANTECMTPGTTFADASGCTYQAALALYGSSAGTSVSEAWKAVGVAAPLGWTVIDTKSNLSAGKNAKLNFSYATPSGAKGMKVVLAGNNGDADLYVRYGSPPTTATYDCRSAGANSNESCTINPAKSGTYYVMINAYKAYSGLTMTVSSGN